MITYLNYESLSDDELDRVSAGAEPPPYPDDIGYHACGAWIRVRDNWHFCGNRYDLVGCASGARYHSCDEVSWTDSGPDATLWETRPAPEGGVPPP